MLSLLQQDPSVCSCVNVGDLWQDVRLGITDWVSVEDANESASRDCCDGVMCTLTHYTPDQPEYSTTQGRRFVERRSHKQRLRDMKLTWLIITCTESDRAWLIENERRKPYSITDHTGQIVPAYEPTRYHQYSARVHIPFESLWSEQGILHSIEQISQGFDLTLDPDHSVELAQAWWNTQLAMGIESPCV